MDPKKTYDSRNPLKWALAGGLVSAVIVITGGFILFRHYTDKQSSSSSSVSENPLASIKTEVSFPLYYPDELPEGFELNTSPVSSQSGIVNFSYAYAGNRSMIVTEQPRPPIMEQVQKTKTFKTSVGEAYIADLNGHKTGFIVSDKTLVILSNIDDSYVDQLVQLMSSMKKV